MATLNQRIEEALTRQRAGEHAVAAEAYESILRDHPDDPDATHLLGLAERDLGRPVAAIERLRRADALGPRRAPVLANLGTTYLMIGRHDEAADHLDRASTLAPAEPGFASNRLLVEHYRPGVTLERLDELHRRFDARYCFPVRRMAAARPPLTFDADPDRPLRLGFLSPDLGTHPVGIFLVGLLEQIAGDAASDLHTACYALRETDDPVARRLREASGDWVDARMLREPDLADRIRADRIDVLFDLCGHTQANRIRTYALRPAPVHATWMGYVGTTGLADMDVLVADPHQVPIGREDAIREEVVRLPDDYVIFDPPAEAPEVVPPPSAGGAPFTFGSFCNPSKLNSPLIAAWARVLDAVPGSRLLLKYKGFGDPDQQAAIRDLFAAGGIEADRILFEGASPRADLLAAYGRLDVCLDTHPYSGGLTTLEALWMGVPVVTLPGETFASRHSLTHLHAAGEPETVAADWDDYVAIARRLAADADALAAARADRRDRMATSPACDPRRFTASVAATVRSIWQRRCAAEDQAS